MLTVLAFHNGDKHLAQLQAEWIANLGGVKEHEMMLVLHATVDPAGVIEPLQRAFGKVFILRVNDKDPQSWPQSANLMFRRAARQIEATSPQPWFWLEPDAVPLVPYWLDELASAYKAASPKKPFMGARVELPGIPAHMTGIAVYPGNTPSLAPLLVTCNNVAFDVNGSSQVLPRMTPTDLIQHEWRPAPFASTDDLRRLRPGAVIYHQDKSGSLTRLLREGRVPELLEVDKAALADIPTMDASRPGEESPAEDLSPEELIQHHIGQLKNIVDHHGREAARQVGMYLAAAGLIPSSPLAPPKNKPGRKPKQPAAE